MGLPSRRAQSGLAHRGMDTVIPWATVKPGQRTWSKSVRLVLQESEQTALRETQASQGMGQESHEKAFAAS